MTKYIRYALFTILMLLTSLAIADQRIVGHMQPFQEERLDTPMTLNCGVTIYEWRGSGINRAHAEKLCQLAVDNFIPYLKTKRMEPAHDQPFRWSMALMPDGRCYRCMNDVQWRFAYRPVKQYVTGYTSFNQRWLYMFGNTGHREFDVTMVHELWHAQSYYYGIINQYPGDDDAKVARDERMAVGFTMWLGLGR
jgi:hypothetical protein